MLSSTRLLKKSNLFVLHPTVDFKCFQNNGDLDSVYDNLSHLVEQALVSIPLAPNDLFSTSRTPVYSIGIVVSRVTLVLQDSDFLH